jgi:hypothetical protein
MDLKNETKLIDAIVKFLADLGELILAAAKEHK